MIYKEEVREIVLLGKQKIIEKALVLLKEVRPDLSLNIDDFDITVWANSCRLEVEFRRLFKVTILNQLPNDFRVYDITVNLISKRVVPFDNSCFGAAYHINTEHEDKILSFVKQKANLPYAEKRNYEYEIIEEESHYCIYIRLNGSFTNYRLHKVTGEVTDFNELWASPALMPNMGINDSDPLHEIY